MITRTVQVLEACQVTSSVTFCKSQVRPLFRVKTILGSQSTLGGFGFAEHVVLFDQPVILAVLVLRKVLVALLLRILAILAGC